MVAALSTMQSLGAPMPEFELPDMCNNEQLISPRQFVGQPVLVMVICNHCPYVVHIAEPLAALANEYLERGIAVIAISANDIQAYPQDGPQPMREFAAQHGFKFPYCLDQSQEVAKAFGAACTPDFFLYDAQHRLCYRGQFDASRPGNQVTPDGADLRAALEAVASGAAVPETQVASLGCSIKWRQGNEPEYF
ncbi:MAG: thioredoxin family protein [Gammaproteobacteria bacterium]|nr:thioredoxin family protein [Gammaproteobacteria bacterium]